MIGPYLFGAAPAEWNRNWVNMQWISVCPGRFDFRPKGDCSFLIEIARLDEES
jgi:hypothetical protein